MLCESWGVVQLARHEQGPGSNTRHHNEQAQLSEQLPGCHTQDEYRYPAYMKTNPFIFIEFPQI